MGVDRITIGVALVLGLSISCSHLALAADPKSSPQPPERSTPSARALPDDICELLDYVEPYLHYADERPARGDAEAMRKFLEKRNARRKATGKSSSDVEAALEKIHATATNADRRLPRYQDAMDLRLVFRTILFSNGPRRGTDGQRAELIDEIKTRLASDPPSRNAVAAAAKVAGALVFDDDEVTAIEFNRQVGQMLAVSPDPRTAQTGNQMLRNAQRLELIGKPLPLEGTLIDGSEFDWASYRGKTVLVEIWATWCAACLNEFPNVERNLRDYHDRGFEVVGINLDVEREALDEFIANHPLAWPTLYDGGPDASPFAQKYGINAGSMAILIDKAGNVVSLRARGAELDRLLAKLLGPPTVDAPAN